MKLFISRYGNFDDFVKRIEAVEGSLGKFSESYKSMGCHVEDDGTFIARQWAPGAQVRDVNLYNLIKI